MFQLIKGASIPDISGLREEYQIDNNILYANVSAENIPIVFESFLSKMQEDEPLFLFIDVPCNVDDELRLNPQQPGQEHAIKKYHRDVFYLDGLNRESMLMLLHSGVGELLINDGLAFFGFGSLDSHVELGKYKYNVLTGYLHGEDSSFLTDIFEAISIPRVNEIVSAWQLFSDENPGESRKYEFDGKDVYVLLDQMKELGLYKSETREED